MSESQFFSFKSVSEHLTYLKADKALTYPLDALQQILSNGKPILKTFPSFGYSSETFWFHLCLDNQSDLDVTRSLMIDFSHLDEVNFHVAIGQATSGQSPTAKFNSLESLHFELFPEGRFHANASRQKELNIYPLRHIQIPAKQTAQVLIEVRSQDNIMLPLTVHNQESLEYFQEWRERSLFFYLGCVGCIFAMALSLFFISKQKLFLYQSVVILFLHILGFMGLRGYGILLNNPWFSINERHLSLSTYSIGTCFFILLVRESIYEATDQQTRDRFLKKFAVAYVAFVPLVWILPFAVSAVIGELAILACGAVVSFKVVPMFKSFRRDASLFYVGFVSLFVVLMYFLLQDFGIIAGPYTGDQVMMVSFAANGVLLSATLFLQLQSLLTKYRLNTFDLQSLLSEQYIRMAFVGHEIRNPLAVAMSWLDLMHKNPALAPKGRLKIHRNLLQINALVSDLQDAQKTEASKMSLEMAELDFVPFLEECLQDHRTLAEEKGIQLKTTNLSFNVKIFADHLRMHQVINNILSNSLKFTPKGGFLEIQAVVLDGNTLEIRISDNGRGMSQQFLKTATNRFSQEHSELQKGVRPGLGLGLFLSRKIMEAHGGTLSIESPGTGLGTLVRLRIPLIEEPMPYYQPLATPSHQPYALQ